MTRRVIIEDQAMLGLRDIQLYPPAFRATSKTAKEGLVDDWVQGQGWLPGRDGVPHGILCYGTGEQADLRWGLLMKEVLLVGEYVARTSMAELYKLSKDDNTNPSTLFSMMLSKAGYPIEDEKDDTNNTLEQGVHVFIDGFDSILVESRIDHVWMREFISFLSYYASVYLRAETAKSAEAIWTKQFLASLTNGTGGNLTVFSPTPLV